MFLRGIYFAPEDGGAGGVQPNGGTTPVGGGTPPVGGGTPSVGGERELSLRARLADSFETDEEKAAFRQRAEKYGTDKDFAKTVNSMFNTYDQRVPLPGADSKPEDWHKLYTRLGKPESPVDYKYDWGETKLDDATTQRVEAFKQYAHEHNFTQAQFEKSLSFYNDLQAKEFEAAAGQIDSFQLKTTEVLRKEWGADFETNLEHAKAAGAEFCDSPEEYKALMDMTIMGEQGAMRIGDHPTLLKIMAKIGRAYSEDARIRNMEKSGEAEGIQAKIAEIEEAARKANVSTSQEPYHSQLAPLYQKLFPKKHKVGQG